MTIPEVLRNHPKIAVTIAAGLTGATAFGAYEYWPQTASVPESASNRITATAIPRVEVTVVPTGVPIPTRTPTVIPTVIPTVRVAKEVCKDQKGTVYILGMQVWYYDRIGGIPNVFEKALPGKPPIEPWVERPALGGSLIVKKPGSNEAINPQDFTTSTPSISGFDLPQLKTNAAFAFVRINGITCTGDMTDPNGKVVPAVELEVTSSQDLGNHTFRKWVPLGSVLPVWFGKKENATVFQKEIENGGPVRDLTDDSRKEILEASKKAGVK